MPCMRAPASCTSSPTCWVWQRRTAPHCTCWGCSWQECQPRIWRTWHATRPHGAPHNWPGQPLSPVQGPWHVQLPPSSAAPCGASTCCRITTATPSSSPCLASRLWSGGTPQQRRGSRSAWPCHPPIHPLHLNPRQRGWACLRTRACALCAGGAALTLPRSRHPASSSATPAPSATSWITPAAQSPSCLPLWTMCASCTRVRYDSVTCVRARCDSVTCARARCESVTCVRVRCEILTRVRAQCEHSITCVRRHVE
mmetsp:Transcript_9250/g.19780  ORF Transcript_9250/g.19780 Transcript_9250/m.19780 type:complete len:255 (-) Transcript_9250:539-1303(-)